MPRNAPPKLTDEQRSAALAKAAICRKSRAAFKGQIKLSEITFAEAITKAETTDTLRKIRVLEALKAVPGIGETTAVNLMDQAAIAPTKRLGGLGKTQRQRIIELVD